MVRISRLFVLLAVVHLASGCSNVRLAIYDMQKRHDYAEATKTSYLKTPAGKAYSLKTSMVEDAQQYLGTPYKYGSMDVKKGFDCSGFVCTVALKSKLNLPRSSSLMAQSAPHVAWKKATSGDLIFFGEKGQVHHVGIIEKNAANELMVIHSTNQRGVISENVLKSDYWKKRILFAVDLKSFQKA